MYSELPSDSMDDSIELLPHLVEPRNIYKADSGAIQFRVRSSSRGAQIQLLDKNYPHQPLIEVELSSRSQIKDLKRLQYVQVDTNNLITLESYRSFWMTWFGNRLCVGHPGHREPFMELNISEMKKVIGYIKFLTKNTTEPVSWSFELAPTLPIPKRVLLTDGKPTWKSMNFRDEMPNDAFVGGMENGELVYVARARHEGTITPGKYIPSKGRAIIGWNMLEYQKEDFQILCGYDMSWNPGHYEHVPPIGAIVGGQSENNTHNRIYIIRTIVDNNMVIGKKHDGNDYCWLPYSNTEVKTKDYFEILCNRPHRELFHEAAN